MPPGSQNSSLVSRVVGLFYTPQERRTKQTNDASDLVNAKSHEKPLVGGYFRPGL